MRITCSCGASIHDNTDGQRHKAYLFADEDRDPMLDWIARSPTHANITFSNYVIATVFQCVECHRLTICRDDRYMTFAPEDPAEDLLRSVDARP